MYLFNSLTYQQNDRCGLLNQELQLSQLGDTTAATFTALKSLSEHENDVPRLVTITLKDAPEWKGAWHDNVASNAASKIKNWIGTHQFFQLRFLCEKTLLPVEGEPGYELKMPKEAFAEFMATAGPITSDKPYISRAVIRPSSLNPILIRACIPGLALPR